jgi:hypothetical protein
VACPPSPDDETFFQRQKVEDYLNRNDPSSENSPVGGQERGLAFCSSEEQFTPMSQSTSNPSIPSVASAGSSAPDECSAHDNYQSMIATASADSMHHNRFAAPLDDLAGYDGDHAVESDQSDSDSEEDALFIGKRKPTQSHRSESISIAEVARSSVQKELRHNRRRSARSGSNGTVKKIPPPGEPTSENTPEAHWHLNCHHRIHCLFELHTTTCTTTQALDHLLSMYKYNTTYQNIFVPRTQALGVSSLDLDMHALSPVLHVVRKSGRRFGIFHIIS